MAEVRELKQLLKSIQEKMSAFLERNDAIDAKVTRLAEERIRNDSDYETLARWAADVRSDSGEFSDDIFEPSVVVVGRYQGMTLREALRAIALENGGLLIVKDAKWQLVREKYWEPGTPNMNQMMYGTIRRGIQRHQTWVKQGPGRYRLSRLDEQPVTSDTSGSAAD